MCQSSAPIGCTWWKLGSASTTACRCKFPAAMCPTMIWSRLTWDRLPATARGSNRYKRVPRAPSNFGAPPQGDGRDPGQRVSATSNHREIPILRRPWGSVSDRIEHLVRTRYHAPHRSVALVHETFRDRPFQKCYARPVEIAGIYDDDCTAGDSQPLPRHRLEQFFKRAAAAWECDDRVDFLDHQSLAFMHVPGEDQFAESAVGPFQVGHELRNHADHAPACTQRAIREVAHRSLAAAPEHQGDSCLGNYPAQLVGGPMVRGIATAARCAIDT